jgi:hypothetical protein
MALTNKLTAIGDAIRAKTGESELLTLDEMAAEIADIPAPVPGSDVYTDYAINGLTTISEDVDWPVVRANGLNSCRIEAQLKNITRIDINGFRSSFIYVPLDFSKVTEMGNSAFSYATFSMREDTTFSFDALQSFTTSSIFQNTILNSSISGNPIKIAFNFPNLVSSVDKAIFSNFNATTSKIASVTFDFPVLTTINGRGDFEYLGISSAFGVEYIVNLPELVNITYSSQNTFAQNAYGARTRPLRIFAPKLSNIGMTMFKNAYLLELELDWNNISEIGKNAFDSSNYEGVYPALPSVKNINNSAFLNASTNLQDISTTPYVWKMGGTIRVFADQKAFSGFSLYNYDGTLRPVVLDFANGLDSTTFSKSAVFQSYNYSSPISIVIRNSTVPTLTYSPTATNGIFGGSLVAGQQVYVPRALLADYQAATNWSVIANNIVAIEDYPDLLDQ